MAISCTRRLAPEDHPAVAVLWHRAWHDAHAALLPDEVLRHRTPESFVHRLPDFAHDAYVVYDDAGPVAFTALTGPEIDQFFLDERVRGTGLAHRLMDEMEAILRGRGVGLTELDCLVGNERAFRFYTARGFFEMVREDRPIWMPDGIPAVFPIHRLAKRLDT